VSAAHELTIVARIAARALQRRLAGHESRAPDGASLRAALDPWLAALPPGTVAAHAWCELPATRPPWFDSGIDVAAGDTVTWFAAGRVYLSKLLDIFVEPSFQLWCRVGDDGPVFRGTRATHTFTAQQPGRLWLASYFPGEWTDRSGSLATPQSEYAKLSGGMTALLLRWSRAIDAEAVLRGGAVQATAPDSVKAEARRLDDAVVAPAQWDYLWYLGASEIYRNAALEDGRPVIRCHTHGDVGILRKEARLPLGPGTRLDWSWRVETLPTDLPEDTLPSHDYVSIAVEFDDGQDLTYYWSASLPAGKVYRCPLPAWKHKETHVVQRSGPAELGRWLDESRDLHADYQDFIGGPARSVVRIWLIANSLFQRGHGRCEYAAIRLAGPTGTLDVL
jgi:hypothetical protein